MTDSSPKEAFVALASPQARERLREPGSKDGYDFVYSPAMGRLLAAHDEIGPAFGRLFAQVMFKPGHLTRPEREMVAAVAAAAQDCFY